MKPWLALTLVLVVLWSVHLAATARHGFTLPEGTRDAVGASAATVWSRFHAHFLAPFFHDGLGHLAYNSALFALAVPIVVRHCGMSGVGAGYLASPLAGILVDALLILPLARAGSAAAIDAAPVRLVGASVFAFACIGLALVALAPRLGLWVVAIVVAIVAYEATLALTGTTRAFVWSYHLTGLALGLAAAPLLARAQG